MICTRENEAHSSAARKLWKVREQKIKLDKEAAAAAKRCVHDQELSRMIRERRQQQQEEAGMAHFFLARQSRARRRRAKSAPPAAKTFSYSMRAAAPAAFSSVMVPRWERDFDSSLSRDAGADSAQVQRGIKSFTRSHQKHLEGAGCSFALRHHWIGIERAIISNRCARLLCLFAWNQTHGFNAPICGT